MPPGNWSRTTTFEATSTPLLPMTKVYFRPPRQAGGPRSGGEVGASWVPPCAVVGHELAQIGSGESPLVIVRSTDGRTVVSSVSVLETPMFLMLPVTVAVLMIVEPAEPTTWPRTV